VVRYASDLGIDFTIIAQEYGALIKALQNQEYALYSSYLHNAVPTKTGLSMHEYEELIDLQRRTNVEEQQRLLDASNGYWAK
jgi:hypothetical protein